MINWFVTGKHREIQLWIKDHYQSNYRIGVEVEKTNYLPDRERHWYQPDVILRDRNGKGEINYIVEVENDPVRKVLVGASILADYCLREIKQMVKPRLIFVVYTEQGIKQISNFVEKLKIAREYCPNLSGIEVYSEAAFKASKL